MIVAPQVEVHTFRPYSKSCILEFDAENSIIII